MNVKDLASKLHGCQYRNEISRSLEAEAKAAGLVVVFGGSDDLMEFRGAMHDEIGACDGTVATIDKQGLVPVFESVDRDNYDALKDFFKREGGTVTITAQWCKEPDYSWTYSTAIPHTIFDVCEGIEPYCRGIVFALADITAAS